MDVPKIKVEQLKLSDIITEISNGNLRIPRFQRNYIWERPRVVALLNSIYKEYPIGTFFFWEAAPEYLHLYRNIPELKIPEPTGDRPFKFILDGQQRITSLYVAIKGLVLTIKDSRQNDKSIDYSEISFDLDREEFTIKRPDNTRFVSLSSVLEPNHFEIFRTLTDERAKAFEKCYKMFSLYPLSVVNVRGQGLGEACEIFERINQGGVKLSLFDLVVASTWSNEFDLKEEVAELNKEFVSKGFGDLDPEIFLQALSLVIKGQATRAAQLQLQKDEISKNWKKITESLKLSVDYLVANLGVKIYEFIPYRAILPMVTYLFAKSGRRSLSKSQKEFLDEWFWKSTFSERYKASTASIMGEDRRDLFDNVLKGSRVKVEYPINVTLKDIENTKMYRYSGVRNGILCLLAQNKPRHFKNGGFINLDHATLSDFNSSERHHIFPRAFLKKVNKTTNENSIANFCFIPSELNLEISSKSPKEYFNSFKKSNEDFSATLKSHLISEQETPTIWVDNYDNFLKQRSNLLLKEIEKRVGKISPIEEKLQDNPNEVIDSIEEEIRIVIDDNLTSRYGPNYWNKTIPGSIQAAVSKRIDANKNRYPDQTLRTGLEKLGFCNLNDYKDIILNHWGLFEDEFKAKGDFERNILFLIDYRNSIKHTRKLTSIQKKQGEAAVEWFTTLLKVQLDKDLEVEAFL
ncbi:MAG: hypothetical protein A2172_03905 [Candidatus Woykebacteria bacterium RBG_13_40_15]|uniref:GmrSD restriction endonucleases N-terminal domain-containing protein n=1 Tax=Candidatus Woykebacteria bacterium RBG_13_40_15 TaxID=1802593 RepID=A0A1G1WA11_9BACT|nr:MAG: hypothetical protein A2172_03905 [Candidatus Woykebacteria bacterium RBG_13_40_15]